MSALIITSWIGRLSNNVLQVIRAIHYAKTKNYNFIYFEKKNTVFKNNFIAVNKIKNSNVYIYNTFFNIKQMGLSDPSPKLMKEYFQEYIYPHFFIKLKNVNQDMLVSFNNTINIHIRSGDVFKGNGAHPSYVQPPFAYYESIIDKNIVNDISFNIVYEDDNNPCVNALKNKYKNDYKISFQSSTLEKDIETLCKSKSLVIGFGTFGLLLYFMNNQLEELYIPEYVLNELPKGDWGITLNVIKLDNYIKCGEWKNTINQKKLMINYKF